MGVVGPTSLVLLLASLGSPLSWRLDPWGANSVRVRAAPPGSPIVDPPVQGLLPRSHPHSSSSTHHLTNGNLRVRVDTTSDLLSAWRVSDGRLLLKMTEISFSSPSVPVTHQRSVASRVAFQGNGPHERIYGLGEHRTGTVNMMPFFKDFAGSTVYSESKGGDSMIPWYLSSRGYGFLWN